MSTLYVVATPIGNLGDMSPRAVETLKKVGLIAAEDTRVTMKLTAHFDIHTPLVSCHQHNERDKSQSIVERMLSEDMDVALVTDAGTPAISDPGTFLVRRCAEAGIPVMAVAGPSAMAAAMSVSGFDCTEFTFYGFLPRQKNELREKLKDMARCSACAIVHESPYRVRELTETIAETLPEARVSASCDLTKLHEKPSGVPHGRWRTRWRRMKRQKKASTVWCWICEMCRGRRSRLQPATCRWRRGCLNGCWRGRSCAPPGKA